MGASDTTERNRALAVGGLGPTAITYVGLPISSGGAHSLGRMGFREACERATSFVGDCAVLVAPREQTFAFLEEVDPQPSNQWGMAPLWLTTSWKVAILDPTTGEPFVGQDASRYLGVEYEWQVPLGVSRVRLNLSNHASMGIEMCLPDIDDARLKELLPFLQSRAPFRFSAKHWRRWVPTKSGSFRAQKITPLG